MGQIDTASPVARANEDFLRRWKGSAIIGAIGGLVGALSDGLLPDEPSLLDRGAVFLAGLAAVAFLIYLGGLVLAPLAQRREAREAHESHHLPRDVEIMAQGVFVHDASDTSYGVAMMKFYISNLRITNRTDDTLSLGFQLLIPRTAGSSIVDDNPAGPLRRAAEVGFAYTLDNPVSVPAKDTVTGELALMADCILLSMQVDEFADRVRTDARLQIVEYNSGQHIEIPSRDGLYDWGDYWVDHKDEGWVSSNSRIGQPHRRT